MTASATPAQMARINRLLEGPAPFDPATDLALEAAGMVAVGRDGLSELIGPWTLDTTIAAASLALADAPQAEARRRWLDCMGDC